MKTAILALIILVAVTTYCLIKVSGIDNVPRVKRDKTCDDCRFGCKAADNEPCERFKN